MKKFLTGFTLLSFLGASAQTDSVKHKSLDEVIVTANKFAQKQSATGKVLTVIDRAQLEKNEGRTLTQVLNEQAGLIINGSQNTLGTNQTVYLQGASSAYTLILVDGMPVNDPTGISMEFDLNHFPIDQIERVEILKGTQSVLYGSEAVAGVINIITRKNKSDNPVGGYGAIAGGSYGTFKTTAGVTGVAGAEKWFSYNVQYNHLQSDGFSAAYDSTGKQNFDNDGYNQNNANVNLTATVAQNWKLKLYGATDHYNTDVDGGQFKDDKTANSISNNNQLALSAVHDYKNGSLTINVSGNEVKRKYNAPNGAYGPYFAKYKGVTFFEEVFTNVNLHKHIGLLAGIDLRNQNASIEDSYRKTSSDSLKSTMFSNYLSLLLKSLGGFNAEIGGRYTYHSTAGSNISYSFNPSYLLKEQVKFFANASSGFRASSLYNLASEYGNKKLSPEKSFSLEGGVQFFNKSKTANLRATYFYRNIKDVIIFLPTSIPPYGQYMNADQQKDNGVELEATINPTSKWSITANYTYLDGKIKSHSSNGKDTSYFNLYRRPKNSFNATVGYTPLNNLYVSIHARWQDKRQDLYSNPRTFKNEIKELSGYYNLDAYAEYKFPLSKGKRYLKVFADFRNITNQTYFDLYGYNSRKFNFMSGLMVSL